MLAEPPMIFNSVRLPVVQEPAHVGITVEVDRTASLDLGLSTSGQKFGVTGLSAHRRELPDRHFRDLPDGVG